MRADSHGVYHQHRTQAHHSSDRISRLIEQPFIYSHPSALARLCPRLDGELFRVFPTRGKRQPWPKPRTGGGGALLYSNYRTQNGKPFLAALGLPEVTRDSARHAYISTLPAEGMEVGLVAKLAGHSNPAVTLGIYTQAMRGGDAAAEALEAAYTG